MTKFEGKMWNMIGSVGWVESGCDFQQIMYLMLHEDEIPMRNLVRFVITRKEEFIQRVRTYELAFDVDFTLTDQELDYLATEVVSRGKLTYDTYTAFPERLTGLHTNYRYTLPRLARVHN